MGSEDTIECKTFRQIFEEELFMHQFVTEPTRHSSILDLVFSDNMDLVKDIVVSNGLGNSDHNMVKFKISSENRPKDNLILVPNFNRADFDSIRNELAQINWKVYMKNMNVFEPWDMLKEKLGQLQSKYIPVRQKRNKVRSKPVWFTPEVRKATRVKESAFKVMKEGQSEANHRAYQIARNEVKRIVRAAKRAKELDLARQCNKGSKKFLQFL